MELSEIEVTAVRGASDTAIQIDLRDLEDLQLAVVGGGMGETINA